MKTLIIMTIIIFFVGWALIAGQPREIAPNRLKIRLPAWLPQLRGAQSIYVDLGLFSERLLQLIAILVLDIYIATKNSPGDVSWSDLWREESLIFLCSASLTVIVLDGFDRKKKR